jgi:hypothetical protein
MKDTYSDKGPICPHCKHEHDADDDGGFFYDHDLTEMTCHGCNEPFAVTPNCTWSWWSELTEDQRDAEYAKEEAALEPVKED